MDLNWILNILTSPYMSLFLLFFIGYFCWQNVYDCNDLADCLNTLATNEATIFIPNPQDINENLTILANITLRFIRGGTLNVGKYSIRNATYKWTSSPAAVNEFYLTTAAGADPGLAEPPDVFEDGAVMRKATLGSLVVGEWNWGDNDGLGYETIYVRIAASADPDGEAVNYVEAAYKVIIEGSVEAGQYRIFEGPGSVVFPGTRIGNGLLKDIYPQWRGSELLEALDAKGGIHLYDRDPQAVVTFMIDDYQNTDGWVALFNSKDIKATAFLNVHANLIVDPTPWLTLQAEGWEMGSHTITHPDLSTLTEEQIEYELAGSKIALENMGFNVRNFCYPGGASNELVRKIVRKYYLGAPSTNTIAYVPVDRPFEMDRLTRLSGDDEILATLQTAVDKAISSEGWLLIGLHAADAAKLTKIGDLIDYIQTRSVQILTMSEAEDLVGNLVTARHFRIGAEGELISKETVRGVGAPAAGTHKRSRIVWNTEPVAGGTPGWICITSGTFSAATDNTGDTTDTSPIIAGMTDTSDFFEGDYVTVSAGFAAGIYKIVSKTATSVTLNANANATVANVTVATSDAVFKAMANLAA